MRSISIRNVPDHVYTVLQDMARMNRRSLQEQIRHLLEQEARLVKGTSTARARAWRSRLGSRVMPDVSEMIREDRER